jgi:hypothetical protein
MYWHLYGGYALRVTSSFMLLLLFCGCHIKLVSDYDDDFVKAATNVEKEISTFLQNMKNPVSGSNLTYSGNIATYNKIEVDLNGLLVLARAHENNDQTIAQVDQIIYLVSSLEKLHKSGPLSPAFVDQEQKDISLAISLVIRTENDKKANK